VISFLSVREICRGISNKNTLYTFLFVLLHQSSIAFSIFASVMVSGYILEINQYYEALKLWVFLYIVAMILPHIIGYFSDVYKEKWLSESLSRFWQSATTRYQSCTDSRTVDHTLGVYVSQGKSAISDFIGYAFWGMSSGLNFFLSLLMITAFIDWRFFVSVMISVLLILGFNKTISSHLEKNAVTTHKAGSSLTSTLSTIHDNVHFGSSVNALAYQTRFEEGKAKYLGLRIKEAVFRYKALLVSSLLALAPTSCVLLFIFTSSSVPMEVKVASIVNLTRIYHLLNSASDIVSLLISFPSIKGQLSVMTCFSKRKSLYQPQWNIAILKDNESVDTVNLTQAQEGRFRVVGENGSGKTSFLRHLCAKNDYLYFNPSKRLLWPWDDSAILSDGMYSAKSIQWLLENSSGHLILDEWDAFLDLENTKKIGALIDSYADSRVIIEVRQ